MSAQEITSEICRTCLKQILNETKFYLDDIEPNIELTTIRHKLNTCTPELNLSIIPNAVICNNCFTAIDLAYKFRNKCLESEKQIQSYVQTIFNASAFVEYMQVKENQAEFLGLIGGNITNLDGTDNIKLEPGIFTFAENHSYVEQTNLELMPQVVDNQTLCKQEFNQDLNINTNSDEQGSICNFQCYNCEYATENKFQFLNHIKGHKVIKPVSSSPTVDSQNPYLTDRHQDKPFKCTECSYSSNQRNNLKRHKTRHMGNSRYKCEVCGYKAAFRSVLIHHMKIHTGEKPFECPECSHKCAYKHNLNVHMKIHMRNKLLMSTECDYSPGVVNT